MEEPTAVARRSPIVVYAIGADRYGPLKIGATAELKNRLGQLQTGNPRKLLVLAAFPGGFELEKVLHRWFDSVRLEGEWFDLDLDAFLRGLVEVMTSGNRAVVRQMIDRPIVPTPPPPAPALPLPVVVQAPDIPAPRGKRGPYGGKTTYTRRHQSRLISGR